VKARSTVTRLARDGTWQFEGLPPGHYLIAVGVEVEPRWDPLRLSFWYPAAKQPEEAEVIAIGENGVVELSLRRPAPPRELHFSGVIVDGEGRVTSAIAFLHDLEADDRVAYAPADRWGRFQVRGWEGRRYTITAHACNGHVHAMSDPVAVDPESREPMRIVLTRPCPTRSR
jgi:hypothetical protein